MTGCTGAGGTGTRYTYAQLEGLWINAGGPKAAAPLAAAVALAESGGCTSALNLTDNNGSQTSVGLWQVSNGTHQYPASWTTAAGNAAEAVAKYKGAGNTFSPWGTYKSGAYKAFLKPGTTPDTSVPKATTSTAVLTSAQASAEGCLISLPKASTGGIFFGYGPSLTLGGECLLGKSTARGIAGVAIMAAGGVIAGAGLVVLAGYGLKSTSAGKAAVAAAGAVPGVAPVAAVVRAKAPAKAKAPAARRRARSGP